MIALLFRALELAWHAHRLYPTAPVARIALVSYVAAREETHGVPAELLIAVAEHESDLHPRAVSWRPRGGKRVDYLWLDGSPPPPDRTLACGMVQTIAATRARCAELLDPGVALRAGVAEIDAELLLARGSMFGALCIYAGGHAGKAAWLRGEETQATRFARLFIGRAVELGWRR